MLSRLVVPQFAYNNADPNKIKQEESPPNKKYVKPLAVAASESLYMVDSIYNP